MASKIKVDQIQTGDGTGTIALQNQLSGMTHASVPTLTTGHMPAGSVLQVQSTTLTGRYATSSTSDTGVGADIGLNVSITPVSSSSKFLINVYVGAAGTASNSWGAILSRGGSKLAAGNDHAGYAGGVMFRGTWRDGTDYNHTDGGGSGQYLDTTSGTAGTAITYKCGFGVQGSALKINSDYNNYSGGATFAHSTAVSTITVMEIAG
jgi:hypothetical protein